MSANPITESDIREMRNRVFDHKISDAAWNSIRAIWLEPREIQFLQAHDFPLVTGHSAEYLAEHA